jgi:RNA polymerase sigma-70 factor (ECF subfamily)
MKSKSEIELLKRARKGDPAASEELFITYLQQSRSIEGFLRRSLRNSEDRQDILHEIFLRLITSGHSFRGEARLSTYVYQVARITVLQKYRRENTLKRGRVYRIISETPTDIPDDFRSNPEYVYSGLETREILNSLINRLPEAYREPLRLRILEDYSYEEIASQLKVPLPTVSTKIHKGKKILLRNNRTDFSTLVDVSDL